MLNEAVTFIEKLESHLQSVRSIPQIPQMMNNMVSSKKIEPAVFSSMENAVLFGCLGYFYVLTGCIETKSTPFLFQDTTLSKAEVLMIELRELTEQILKWEELQKEVYSNNVHNTADLDFGLSLT